MQIIPVTKSNIKRGDRVLLRASLDVPMTNGVITSNYRLVKSARTIMHLQDLGARVTVIGHLGRKGESLEKVYEELKNILKTRKISFAKEVIGEETYKLRSSLNDGETLLLNNVRTNPGEFEEDYDFGEELINEVDYFVFDDFSVSHRDQTSITYPAKHLPIFFGIQFYEEITAMKRITESVSQPAFAILGGKKLETKLPLLKRLLDSYQKIFVAGVMANTLLKAKGCEIGKSIYEDIDVGDILTYSSIVLPVDFTVINGDNVENRKAEEIQSEDMIVDIGEESLKLLEELVVKAQTIVWNGPLGYYQKGFHQKTIDLADMIGETDGYSVVGGGDTISVLEKGKRFDNFTFVSTGGGAMLSYLSGEEFPILKIVGDKNEE